MTSPRLVAMCSLAGNQASGTLGDRLTTHRVLGTFVLLALLGFFAGAGTPARAEVVAGPPPANLTIDGDPGEWADRPVSMILAPATPGARSGRVWLAQSADGVLIAARIAGPPPRFAKSPEEMASADHVELWVALADQVALPKVGWGNQFGPVELDSADDCAKREEIADDRHAIDDCRAWYAEQQAYRRQFRKLFVRQWQMAPGVVTETYAKPAFAQIPEEARKQITALAPSTAAESLPAVRFAPVSDGGYGVEIAVPWAAFPPSATQDLSRLRLMLDVFSPGAGGSNYGPFATTSPERKYGEVSTLNPVRLDPIRHWRIGRCGYPLSADDQWGEQTLPAYFLPVGGEQVNDIFVIENYAAGYQYTPAGYSPVITPTRFFSQEVAPELILCGPPLAVHRGGKTSFIDATDLLPGQRIKPVTGGWLVAQGPFVGTVSQFGSGMCGACPLISLQVLFLPATDAAPVVAFSDSWLVEEEDVKEGLGRNARVMISDDLVTITAWEGEAADDQPGMIWTRVRQCYKPASHTYEECGREENAKPPLDIPMPPDEPAL